MNPVSKHSLLRRRKRFTPLFRDEILPEKVGQHPRAQVLGAPAR